MNPITLKRHQFSRAFIKTVVECFRLIIIITMVLPQIPLGLVKAEGEADRFVSKTGTDSGDCVSSPCLTIAYAVNQSVSDDTIHIGEGVYFENLTLDKNIALLGVSLQETIIDGGELDNVITIVNPSSVSLRDLTIQNGYSAVDAGGGVANHGTVVIERVKITSNTAINGGGIYANGSTSISDSIISDNTASVTEDSRGGGIITGTLEGIVSLDRVLLTGNEANKYGGAVFNGANIQLLNVTITNNRALVGSGIYNDTNRTANIFNTTIVNNISFDGGSTGGVRNYSNISFRNSIISTNFPSNCFNGVDGVWISLGNNLDNGTSCLFTEDGDIQSTDPLLGPLQDNGGLSMTMALLLGSPAIDTGSNIDCPVVDQRGVERPFGSSCDIGAYEYQVGPGAFNKVNPINGTSGTPINLTLSWGSSTNSDSYEYCYDTSEDGACSEWTSTGTTTSVALTNLLPGTTYYWQVRAINTFANTYANGAENAFWSFQTGFSPNTFGKTSPADTADQITINPELSWEESGGATTYQYCYDTSNDNACSPWINNSTETSVPLSGLSLNTTFYWQVRAINEFGTTYADGSDTTFWSFTTGNVPDVFTKVAPLDVATNQSLSPTLNWTASPGSSSYQYCYDKSNDNACSSWVDNGSETSVALSGLTSNTQYFWQVRAINDFGTTYADGNESTYWSFTTGDVPGAFNKNTPLDDAFDQTTNISLTWETSNNAEKYEYCIDTTDDNDCSGWTDNGTNTNKLLTGINPGNTYYWNVRAVNIHGITYANESSSSWWSFTVSNKPGYFNKISPTNSAPRQLLNPIISWTPSVGATSYQFCVSSVNPCTNWVNNGLATSKTLTGLSLGTTYYWNVRAVNSYGKSYADLSKDNWSFMTGTKPEVFNKIAPTKRSTNQALEAILSWNDSVEASSYEYCIDTTNDNKCNTGWIFTETKTSIQLSGLTRSTSYYWQVRARNTFGKTFADNGNWWVFTTTSLKPGPFSKIAPMNGATNQLTNSILSWETSLNAVNYEYCIDRINDNICTTGWQSVGIDTSITHLGLKPGKKYFWLVRARNSYGKTKSNAGVWWSFTTKP